MDDSWVIAGCEDSVMGYTMLNCQMDWPYRNHVESTQPEVPNLPEAPNPGRFDENSVEIEEHAVPWENWSLAQRAVSSQARAQTHSAYR
jgi:hypothetical protein